MLKDVHFTFQHENCWMLETTQRHPSATIVVSSVYLADTDVHADIVVHAPSRDLVQTISSEWKRDPRVSTIRRLYEGPNGARFHVSYPRRLSIYPQVVRHSPVSVGNASIALGLERMHIVGDSHDVDDLIARLNEEGTARIESVRNLKEFFPQGGDVHDFSSASETPPASTSPTALTDRQIDALLLARTGGYYNWPRKSSATDLARMTGVTSTAFLLQLRRAEARVMTEFIDRIAAQNPARRAAMAKRFAEGAPERRRPPRTE